MSSSLEAMLALIEADVPERLISAHAFAALKSICRLLPIDISSGIGFESRLAERSPEIDLILLAQVPRGLEILAGIDPSCRLPDYFFEDASWERLRSLAIDWQTWPKPLREAVVAAWLEFDASQFASPAPRPGLLFLEIGKPDRSRDYCEQIARRAYTLIKNRPIHSELAAALNTCLKRLPDHGVVLSVGMSISRPTEAIRLILTDLTAGDVLNYLSSTGWAGNLREMESLFLELGRYIHQFNLNIDILTSVCPKIGIECFFGRQEKFALHRSWTDFLEFITGTCWCLQEKSDGLAEWPGRNWFQAGTESWPWAVERFLSHIKINYDARSGVEAKAYFGLVWRPTAAPGTPMTVS